jgi:hypothetical protein
MENHIILPSGRHWNRGRDVHARRVTGPGAVRVPSAARAGKLVRVLFCTDRTAIGVSRQGTMSTITSPAMSPLDLAVRGVLAIAACLRRPHWVWPCVFGDGWCRHLRLSRHRRLHAG